MEQSRRHRAVIARVAPQTPADWITVGRAALGAVCAVVVILAFAGVVPPRSWAVPLLLAPAFALDAVDGAVARRTGTVSARGAQWDVEVDAAVLLVACIAFAPYAPWTLAIGSARYLFGVAGRLRGWPRALPHSQARRVIGGVQGVALVIALVPVVPIWLAQAITGVALLLLCCSFGRDIRYQERRRRQLLEGSGGPGAPNQ